VFALDPLTPETRALCCEWVPGECDKNRQRFYGRASEFTFPTLGKKTVVVQIPDVVFDADHAYRLAMVQLYRHDGGLDTLPGKLRQRSSLITPNESFVARSGNRSYRAVISDDKDSKTSRHIAPISRRPTSCRSPAPCFTRQERHR